MLGRPRAVEASQRDVRPEAAALKYDASPVKRGQEPIVKRLDCGAVPQSRPKHGWLAVAEDAKTLQLGLEAWEADPFQGVMRGLDEVVWLLAKEGEGQVELVGVSGSTEWQGLLHLLQGGANGVRQVNGDESAHRCGLKQVMGAGKAALPRQSPNG